MLKDPSEENKRVLSARQRETKHCLEKRKEHGKILDLK